MNVLQHYLSWLVTERCDLIMATTLTCNANRQQQLPFETLMGRGKYQLSLNIPWWYRWLSCITDISWCITNISWCITIYHGASLLYRGASLIYHGASLIYHGASLIYHNNNNNKTLFRHRQIWDCCPFTVVYTYHGASLMYHGASLIYMVQH